MGFSPSNPAVPPESWGDKFTIDTPEQTSLEFSLAGIGSRFLALAIDTLIQIAAAALVGIAAALLISAIGRTLAGPWIAATVFLLLFLAFYGYFAIFEALWNGQTPGKRMIRLRVIKDNGQPIRAVESVGRNLLRIVDQLPLFYAIGIVSVLLSRKSKRLGDFVAGTIVVHERALEDIKPVWETHTASDELKLGSEHLTLEDLALVEAFLNRRSSLAGDVRYNAAAKIVDRLRPKLRMPEGVSLRNEQLLEAIASERRSAAKYT
jgi:uncharacterized RDD family membrane protein YckC